MDKFVKARNARKINWGTAKLPTGREGIRNLERLHYKFIANYIEALHPHIYEKAEKLYKETKEANPLVRDLTKTVKFMSTVTPHKKIPPYYYQRERRHEQTMAVHPQMVLEIPLLNSEQLTTQTVPQQTSAESTQQTTPEHTAPQQTPVESPLQLSPDVYNNILLEIQKDPEMWRVFQDITGSDDVTNDQTDDFMNDEIWNEVCIDSPTPLEKVVEQCIDSPTPLEKVVEQF